MRPHLAAALALIVAPASLAQSALIRAGDPDPAGNMSNIVDSFGAVAVSPAGGYGVLLTTTDGMDDINQLWGSLAGGPGGLIRVESSFAGLAQTSIEFSFGLNETVVAYSAVSTDSGGNTGIDGIWLNDIPFVLEGDAVQGAPEFFTFMSRPAITTAGVPIFVGGSSATVGGSTSARGLYVGNTALYRTGDIVPGHPDPLSNIAVDLDSTFSPSGTFHLAILDSVAAFDSDAFIARGGQALTLSGRQVREGTLVPAIMGGRNGERWQTFERAQITDVGQFAFSGDTDAFNSSADGFIVRNGVMYRREGDVVDGVTLTGNARGLAMNATSELAYIWADPSGDEVLFFNDDALLRVGDSVDWDGDGMVEATSTLIDFIGGTKAIALGDGGTIFFTAEVDVNGTVRDGFFRMETRGLQSSPFCSPLPNSTGSIGTLAGEGTGDVLANSLALRASALPPGQFGIFVVSRFINAGTTVGNGTLCLTGAVGRFTRPGQILQASPAGSFRLPLDLAAIPTPNSFVQVVSGQTFYFQAWHRDGTPTNPGSNFTEGLRIDFE